MGSLNKRRLFTGLSGPSLIVKASQIHHPVYSVQYQSEHKYHSVRVTILYHLEKHWFLLMEDCFGSFRAIFGWYQLRISRVGVKRIWALHTSYQQLLAQACWYRRAKDVIDLWFYSQELSLEITSYGATSSGEDCNWETSCDSGRETGEKPMRQ